MAGVSDKIKKLQEQLKSLKEQYESITLKDAPLFEEDVQDAKKLENSISQMKVLISEMKPDLQGISDIFTATVKELTKGNNEITRQRNSLKKITSIANDLIQIKKGESSVDKKQINSIQEKLALEKSLLLQIGREQASRGESTKEIRDQIVKLNGVAKAAQDVLDTYNRTNKQLGFVPQVLGGIDKQLSKLGFPELGVTDALDKTQKLAQSAEGTQGILKTWSVFIKEFSKNLSSSLSTANLLQFTLGLAVSIFKDLDSGAGDYAKSMNVSYSEAMATRAEMQDLALATGDAALNSKRLMETQVAVSKSIGSTAKLNKADLKTMTEMVRKMGLTHKEIMGVQKMSLLNGKTLKQNTKEIVGAAKAQASKNKLVVNEKDVLKEVSNASAALTLSLGNNPKELARAVVQAKQFGLTLEQADKIASSLLNFEQSIENELSAELLTGKDLNYERARALALNGDTAAAAEEIAKQFQNSAEFSKMNVIQQEAVAKSAGLTREELAKSIMDREALAKMSEVEGASAQEKYNNLRKTMSAEEAAEKLGDTKMAQMYEQQSAQDKFNDSMEQLKEMLANELMPIFMGMADFLREHMNLIKPIVQAFVTLKGISMALNALSTIRTKLLNKELMMQAKNKAAQIGNFMVGVGKYAVNAAASAAQVPIVGPILAIAALAAAVAGGMALTSYFSKGDDVVSPGYGDRTLFGPEGAIQLNNKDTVIAGTNLFGDDTISEPGKATEMFKEGELKAKGGGDMANVVSAINALGAQLDTLATRPINVQVGEDVVIKAAVGNDPKTTGDEIGKNSYQMN